MPVLSSMLVISASRSRRFTSLGGYIGVRNVSNSRGSTNAIFRTCAIYANSWLSSGRKTVVANGANNAGRKPPLCCISRRLLDTDNLLFTSRRSLFLYFLKRTFSCGVSRTVPLSILCAHSHRALIRSASACSSMAFRSFVFFVLLSIWRQRTCLFRRLDIARLTVVPRRHPFYTRPQIECESAHRPLLSTW